MNTTLALFVTTAAILIVTPGPTMLLALSNGATYGMRIAAFGFLGAGLGSAVVITTVALGFGALLKVSEQAFTIVKWVGVVYLLWLALALWRSHPQSLAEQSERVAASRSRRSAFLRCFTVSVTNPKGILFLAAFLPQFIDVNQPQFPQYLLLGTIFTVLDMICMTCYAYGGRQLARMLTAASMRHLNWFCACVMVLLAGFLAVFQRPSA